LYVSVLVLVPVQCGQPKLPAAVIRSNSGRVGAPQGAVAGGVQHRAVRQHGHRHGLADLRLAPGQGDLLEPGRVDGDRRFRR